MLIDLKYHSQEEPVTDPFFAEYGLSFHIKRDDLIHPFISGNKWRKLKYLLQNASSLQKTSLVTFGGPYSNHLLATACAAAKFGFTSTGFVRGEAVENPTLLICRMFGMQLRFIERERYRDKKHLFDHYFGHQKEAFFIDEGGASEEAVTGCSEIIQELEQHYDYIFCAAGTGTTAAGLLKGIAQQNLSSALHVVPVLKNGEFIRQEIEKFFRAPPEFTLHSSYHFGGYAKTSTELLEFLATFSAKTGILLDPVYTGKMAYAIYDLTRKNFFRPGSKILMLHTGGLLGLLGMQERLGKVLY